MDTTCAKRVRVISLHVHQIKSLHTSNSSALSHYIDKSQLFTAAYNSLSDVALIYLADLISYHSHLSLLDPTLALLVFWQILKLTHSFWPQSFCSLVAHSAWNLLPLWLFTVDSSHPSDLGLTVILSLSNQKGLLYPWLPPSYFIKGPYLFLSPKLS